MTDGHIHTRYRTVAASVLLDTLGDSLDRIKSEDVGTTDADLGVVASYHLEDDLTMAFSAQGQRIEQAIASRIDVTLVPPADASHPPSSPR